MSFAYGDGVGVPSWQAIESLGASSGIAMQVTQTNPAGSGGYHGTGNAVDFSNGGDAGTPEMDAFAKFWLGYAAYLLELIHVNQDGSTVAVKNGQLVDGLTFYGAATMEQHHNHVHVAATAHGMQAAGAGGATADGSTAVASGTVSGSNSGFSALSVFTGSFWKTVGIAAAGIGLIVIGGYILKNGLSVGGINIPKSTPNPKMQTNAEKHPDGWKFIPESDAHGKPVKGSTEFERNLYGKGA